MGGFQNFAISFTIISILAGCLTSYYIGYSQGGPVAITWGWLIVGLACTLSQWQWARSLRPTRRPGVSTSGRLSSGDPAGVGSPAGSTW